MARDVLGRSAQNRPIPSVLGQVLSPVIGDQHARAVRDPPFSCTHQHRHHVEHHPRPELGGLALDEIDAVALNPVWRKANSHGISDAAHQKVRDAEALKRLELRSMHRLGAHTRLHLIEPGTVRFLDGSREPLLFLRGREDDGAKERAVIATDRGGKLKGGGLAGLDRHALPLYCCAVFVL